MKCKGFASLIVFLLIPFFMEAQYVIRGKVFAADDKEALPFVSIIIKGTTIGVQTDFDGHFTLNSPKMGDSLVATYVGYKRLARPLNKSLKEQDINFPLSNEGGLQLDEVVIKAGENPAH